MTMNRMRTRDGGFSLVEVMIGIAIIVLGLFAVLSTTIHTNTTKESQREMEIAKEAAMRKIEEIRGLAWGSFANPVLPPDSSVVNTYAGGLYPAFPIDGLQADPGDTGWYNAVSNPKKQGKGRIIIHGTNPTPLADPVLLVDYEVLIEWKGIRGESRYSCRMMLAKDQGK
jgi:prepilin-type N-terminal cleavage/methylation domain-containing protein